VAFLAAAFALVAAARAKRNLRLPTGLAALLAMQFLSGHFGADHASPASRSRKRVERLMRLAGRSGG
jgi:hypothetical protein